VRAARIDRPGALALVDVEPLEPAAGEAVVTVAYAGICGSDVELFRGGRPPGFVEYPLIPGHEWSGTVARVGDGVDAGLVGRKVVGEGFRSCGRCDPCRDGNAVLCATGYDEIGFTRPGAWAEQLTVPAAQLHVLPGDVDLRAAALLEPAACSAAAVARAAIEPGARVAVVGAGALGALAVQLARRHGPAEIVVVEPEPGRADIAARCGATRVVGPDAIDDLHGCCDVVIEAAGSTDSAELALGLVRRGGRLVLAGIPPAAATVRVRDLVAARVDVATVFGAPSAAWRDAVAALATGALDPALLISHTVDLAEIDTAIALVSGSMGAVGKVLLAP